MTAVRHLATERQDLDLSDLGAWVLRAGLAGLPLKDLFQGYCDRLRAAGFPMVRANMGIETLHPLYGSYVFVWRPDGEVAEEAFEHGAELESRFLDSPIHYMRRTRTWAMRRRLDGDGELEFPVLRELRAEGMTEYAARIVRFGEATDKENESGMFFSCATDWPGGLNDEHVRQVQAVLPLLALACKSRGTFDVASSVLETYLGADAGQRVLRGEIKRGATETIRAVLWHCDLRDFTELADRLPRDELVALLNEYLDCLAAPVHAHGGQILKFMGDGFLAAFDLAAHPDETVCRTSLAAAVEARGAVAAFNRERAGAGLPTLGVGLALHLGDVAYGNIGAGERLDFTVIGPAVNEVSRIQALCRDLDRDLLISKTFYDVACECQGELVTLGQHRLRGVRQAQELFTLAA